MKYTPSSELQRESEQLVSNEKRLQAYRLKTTMNASKEKKVSKLNIRELLG